MMTGNILMVHSNMIIIIIIMMLSGNNHLLLKTNKSHLKMSNFCFILHCNTKNVDFKQIEAFLISFVFNNFPFIRALFTLRRLTKLKSHFKSI